MNHTIEPPKRVFHRLTLNKNDIIQLLNGGHEAANIRADLKEVTKKKSILYNAHISMEVPAGGDFSNQTLELDETTNKVITVTWWEDD